MWLMVCCLYKEVYLQFYFLNVCPFYYTAVAGSGKVLSSIYVFRSQIFTHSLYSGE